MNVNDVQLEWMVDCFSQSFQLAGQSHWNGWTAAEFWNGLARMIAAAFALLDVINTSTMTLPDAIIENIIELIKKKKNAADVTKMISLNISAGTRRIHYIDLQSTVEMWASFQTSLTSTV